MGDCSLNALLFKEIIMFKCHLIKPQSPKKGYLGSTIFTTDYITVVAAKVWTNSREQPMFSRFL
jgi:hypothetical protein